MNKTGTIDRYFCNCYESGICWIVRHPDLKHPVSYPTENEAIVELDKLRKMKPEGLATASKTEGA